MRLSNTAPTRWLKALVAVLVFAGAVVASAGAGAQENARPYLKGSYSFTDHQPGQATGVAFEADLLNPDDPEAKPPAARDVTFQSAPGTVIDTGVPERCAASDLELMANGPSACPAASRVGTGEAIVDTGFPGPGRKLVADIVVLNNTNELILVTTERNSGLHVIVRTRVISPERVDGHMPFLPGTPPNGGSLDYIRADLFKLSRELGGITRNYITAPDSCDGAWLNTVLVTFDDGVKQRISTSSACEPTLSAGGLRAGRCANARQGTPAADRLIGTLASDMLRGGAGNDVLRGGLGDDCLLGGAGRDRLSGGAGADALRGGRDFDRLYGDRGNDRIWAADGGRDVVRCGAGRDWTRADPVDSVRGCETVLRRRELR